MKKYITIERVLLLLLLGLFIFREVKHDKQYKELSLRNAQLDTLTNKLGQQVIVSQTELTQSQEALRAATDSFFNLRRQDEKRIKDIIAFYKGTTNTVIREVLVPYVDKEQMKEWEDSIRQNCSKVIDYYEANTVTVPRSAKDSSKHYDASFTVTMNGVKIDSLSVPDSQYLRFVTLKGGFLKKDQQGKRRLFLKKSLQVQVIHTNPLVQVTGQTSAVYQPPKKRNLLFKAGLITLGIFLGTKL